MSEFLDRLELRTNRAYWGDGLLDLFCAVALLALGLSWVTHHFVFGPLVPALLVPLWKPVRQRFTTPRLGMVELAEERQGRNLAFMRMMLMSGCLTLLAGVGLYFARSLDFELKLVVVKALPGLLVGLAGIAVAEALQLRRFLIYGGMTVAAAAVVAVVPELNPGWAFMAGGSSALVGGVTLASQFVGRYPVASEDGSP